MASPWRQNHFQVPLHLFVSVRVFLWPLLPRNSGAIQIYWPPATFVLEELAVRINGISTGSWVPVYLNKSHHFGKCLWGKITVWESRNLSVFPQSGRDIVPKTFSEWPVCSLFIGYNFKLHNSQPFQAGKCTPSWAAVCWRVLRELHVLF